MLRWLFGSRRKLEREADEGGEDWVDQTSEPVVPIAIPFTGEFSTDTASLVMFDPSALSHRVDDECDWWADPNDELGELKARNALIVGLGADGVYEVEVTSQSVPNAPIFSLRAPSGTLFVGPGEEITGGGYEPDGRCGGYLIAVTPGDYAVSAGWHGDVVRVGLVQAAPFENEGSEPVRI